MGKLGIEISDKLEKEFRAVIFAKFAMKKGNINKAFEEAIKDWTEKNKPKKD